MNNSLRNILPLLRDLKRVYQPGINRLTHRDCTIGSVLMLITLVACRPQIIEVEKPVTRIVEIPVQIVVTEVVEKFVPSQIEPTSVAKDGPLPRETQMSINAPSSVTNVALFGSA